MTLVLKYGLDASLEFSESQTHFLSCQRPLAPLIDLPIAVEAAVTQPLNAPSLRQAILPGDKVALALPSQVPCGPTVAQAVLQLLMQWDIAPADITLLVSTAESDSDAFAAARRSGISVVSHNPTKRESMAYLGASPAGEPLYLNRVLCDSDVVIPIGGVRMQARGAVAGDGLYPVFSNSKLPADKPGRRRGEPRKAPPREPQESPDVCWLLGVPCLLQVVPGPGSSALAVLAGEPASVRRQSREQCQAAWSFDLPEAPSLVVAALEGDASQQTWEQVSRALAAATQAVAEGGAIALCCDLEQELGPALQTLAESEDRHDALRAIRRARLPDAQIATRLVRASDRATVYMLSRLKEDVVEDLGMAYIEQGDEVPRLASRHESCLLLANAQHARAFPRE